MGRERGEGIEGTISLQTIRFQPINELCGKKCIASPPLSINY